MSPSAPLFHGVGFSPSAQLSRNQCGLTLVEVLVAVALLAAGLLPVAYMQSSGTRSTTAAYGVVAASALAVQLCDDSRNIPYTDSRLTATSNYAVPDSTLSNTNPLTANGQTWSACGPWTVGSVPKCGFARTWKVTDNTPIPNTKRIDVQVTWSEYGIARTFTLSTLKAVGS